MKRITPLLCTILMHLPFVKNYAQPTAQPCLGATAYNPARADAFAFTINPAALASLQKTMAGIYVEQPFLIQQAGFYRAVSAFTVKKEHFGLRADQSGIPAFRETRLGAAYGRSLGRVLDAGLLFEYAGYRLRGYGTAMAVTAGVGLIWHGNEKVHGGISLYNPVRVPWRPTGERMPAIYRVGVGYAASGRFYIHTELIKEEEKPVDILAGVQYSIAPGITLCAGLRSGLSSIYAGGSIGWSHFRALLSVSHHPELGISPGIALLYSK